MFNTFGGFGGINRHLLIGLNDAASEGNFEWISGEAFTFNFWYPFEPNNNLGIEDHVHMFAPTSVAPNEGRWNDYANNDFDPAGFPYHGVVEVMSRPATPVPLLGSFAQWILILALAGLGAWYYRRDLRA